MQYVKITLPTWKKIEKVIKEFDRLGFNATQQTTIHNDDTVLIRNDSTIQCQRFNILQISGIAVTPADSLQDFQQRPVFTGAAASDTTGAEGRLVVCAEPIGPGQIGRAWADGVVMTRIDISNESHTCATIKPDDITQLKSGETGLFCILWKESGSGTRWAVVRYGGSGGSSGLRWVFLKEVTTATTWSGYLDTNLTGEVVSVQFTLTGGATSTANAHYTLVAGLPLPVMRLNDQWRCLIPLQGVESCS